MNQTETDPIACRLKKRIPLGPFASSRQEIYPLSDLLGIPLPLANRGSCLALMQYHFSMMTDLDDPSLGTGPLEPPNYFECLI